MSGLRIFLGNGPWWRETDEGRERFVRAGSRWPHFEPAAAPYVPFPFFLAHAAAWLEMDGHPVRLTDGPAEGLSEAEFVERAASFDPSLVVLETSAVSEAVDRRQAAAIREACPGVTVFFAGLHAAAGDPGWLADVPEVDGMLLGEYEATLRDLARALDRGGSPADVPGLVWRDRTGDVRETGRRPLLENVDDLPDPAWHHLPMLHAPAAGEAGDVSVGYCDDPWNLGLFPQLQSWASRGCPFECTFCAWPQMIYSGRRYRVRSPERIAREWNAAVERFDMASAYFDDDTFNLGRGRLTEWARVIAEQGPGRPFSVMARADTCTMGEWDALIEAGLCAVKFGVESGCQELVDACRKELDLEEVRRTCEALAARGIRIHLTFAFGLPGETRDTVRRTIDYACGLPVTSAQFSIITPFPGSAEHRRARETGTLVTEDLSLYDGYSHAVIRTEEMGPDDLVAARIEAEQAFARSRAGGVAAPLR